MIFLRRDPKIIDVGKAKFDALLKNSLIAQDLIPEDFAEMVEEEHEVTIFLERNIPKPSVIEGKEWVVAKRVKNKFKKRNPKTNRMKKFKSVQWHKTTVAPLDRTFKNMPKYADGKSICRFQDWLAFQKGGTHSTGHAANGNWYGWSHRAVGEFKVGKEVKKGDCFTKKGKTLPYTIKTEAEAKEHAIGFARSVS